MLLQFPGPASKWKLNTHRSPKYRLWREGTCEEQRSLVSQANPDVGLQAIAEPTLPFVQHMSVQIATYPVALPLKSHIWMDWKE